MQQIKVAGMTPSTKGFAKCLEAQPAAQNNARIIYGDNGVLHAGMTMGKSATIEIAP